VYKNINRVSAVFVQYYYVDFPSILVPPWAARDCRSESACSCACVSCVYFSVSLPCSKPVARLEFLKKITGKWRQTNNGLTTMANKQYIIYLCLVYNIWSFAWWQMSHCRGCQWYKSNLFVNKKHANQSEEERPEELTHYRSKTACLKTWPQHHRRAYITWIRSKQKMRLNERAAGQASAVAQVWTRPTEDGRPRFSCSDCRSPCGCCTATYTYPYPSLCLCLLRWLFFFFFERVRCRRTQRFISAVDIILYRGPKVKGNNT
jgi:hypothetical protein